MDTSGYTISKNRPGDDFSKLVGQTLRNNISIISINTPQLLRRGASNNIDLKVIGGWDYGSVHLQKASITIPPGSGKTYRLKISNGSFKLGPKEQNLIQLSFDLPSDDVQNAEPDKPIDGLLNLKFKEGKSAEMRNKFISFHIEHWFEKYRLTVYITIAIILILLFSFWMMMRRPLKVKVLISGQDPMPAVRLREGQTVSMGTTFSKPHFHIQNPSGNQSGSIKLKKSWRKLIVTGTISPLTLNQVDKLEKGDNILIKRNLEILGVQVSIVASSK